MAFVNEKDEPLYTWEQRHSIKPSPPINAKGEVESDSDMTEESHDGEWFEEDVEELEFDSDSGDISDDSEDSPYNYEHQNDLDSHLVNWSEDAESDQE